MPVTVPWRLFAYVRTHGWALGLILVLVMIVGALEAASPFLIGLVFDTVLRGASASTLPIPLINLTIPVSPETGRWFLILLVVVTIVKATAEYASVNLTSFLGQAVVRDLRNDVYRRVLHQPLSFFHFNPTGDLISRISTDVERVQVAVSETLAEFLKQSAILLFLLITVFAIDWWLATLSLILIPLVAVPTVWFGKKLRSLGRTGQREMATMANLLFESFAGNRIVKAFTMEDSEFRRFQQITSQLFRINIAQKATHSLSSPIMEILGISAVAMFILYAQTQIVGQRMTVGLFLAFIISMIKLYDPVRRMSGIYASFQQAFGASGRIFEILDLGTEHGGGGRDYKGFDHEIEFRNVSFSYDGNSPVLDDVSFTLRKGEVVALVGPSGAGKTTLVDLIPRFHEPASGSIRIDGVDIREYRSVSLRRHIAIVTQDVILFNDSIRNNIAYGDPGASEAAIREAARAALVEDFVLSLPDGYDTVIGERGLRLSGGERQRLSIARAILRNASILILDEATSSLDAESESLVQRALNNLMQGRTTIVIAHRLSTVRNADRAMVLADGRILESGRHDELLGRRGMYWKLHNLQFQDVNS